MATVPEQVAARVHRSQTRYSGPPAARRSRLVATLFNPAALASAASVLRSTAPSQRAARPRRLAASGIIAGPIVRYREEAARGLFRVFNKAGWLLYWNDTRPPEEEDAYDEFADVLPYEPSQVFGDGTWYFAMEKFNGCIRSGFRQMDDYGRRYRRLDISGGAVVDPPPKAPVFPALEERPDGYIRVYGRYFEANAALAATEWSVAFSATGPPPEDDPGATIVPFTEGPERYQVLRQDIGPFTAGVTVRVRLQVRRAGTVYSEDSFVRELQVTLGGGPSNFPIQVM